MLSTFKNAWRIPELRKKIMFTMVVLLAYRVGNAVTVPYLAPDAATLMREFMSGTVLDWMNMMSGSGLANGSLLALGIQPYINASIIVQLLTVAIPALERLAKDGGEEGKKKINQITRITTLALGVLMGIGAFTLMANNHLLTKTNFMAGLVIVGALTAGSCMVMWMGEQITEHGIGNGISMILFANILAGLPTMFRKLAMFTTWWQTILVALGLLALIVLIVFINDAERRIPIQYAKRVVGRKVYGGQNTNLPIKVAMSGVMPVIFAQTIAMIPGTIYQFGGIEPGWWYEHIWNPSGWLYAIVYALLIFFFSWFYSQIQYDPVEISNNLKKNGGFIPGFRPGKPTGDFIKKVIGKIVIFGAVYLTIVALLPMIAGMALPAVSSLAIGGTSIIIVVSVALETVKALEAQMLMRHYKGFLD